MMRPVTELPMTDCPMCEHASIGGPEYRRGNWGNRYYGWLVYWCMRCKFEQKVPTKEDRAKDQALPTTPAVNVGTVGHVDHGKSATPAQYKCPHCEAVQPMPYTGHGRIEWNCGNCHSPFLHIRLTLVQALPTAPEEK